VAHATGGTKKRRMGQAWRLKPVILATWEAEIGRIAIQGPLQKVSRTHLNHWLVMMAHACHPQLYGEAEIRESQSRPAQA
jgi:hypothetical protein